MTQGVLFFDGACGMCTRSRDFLVKLGHRPALRVDGATMRWECDRCGRDSGAEDYDSPDEARRYAAAFIAATPTFSVSARR